MNIKKFIYFSPIGFVVSVLQNFVASIFRPFMVYGYRNRVTNKRLKRVRISSTAVVLSEQNLDISDNVWIWHHTILDASNHISIGEGCQIGAWVGIFSHSSHIALRLHGRDYINVEISKRIGYVRAPVVIGAYTFIGAGAIILPGVTIGKGSLISASAVVNKDVPEYSIAAGNPAKIIGSTLDLDNKFFDDSYVRNNYFDQSVVREYNL